MGKSQKYTFQFLPFDSHCCRVGTAITHPVLPDRVKQSFVIFDTRAHTLTLRGVKVLSLNLKLSERSVPPNESCPHQTIAQIAMI